MNVFILLNFKGFFCFYSGYISIDVVFGNLMWRDVILRFFVLFIMDIYGDVIGLDGYSLVMYMDDGLLKLVIYMMDWVYLIFRFIC